MKRILCWLGFHKYQKRWDTPLWHKCFRCGHCPAPGPHIIEIGTRGSGCVEEEAEG